MPNNGDWWAGLGIALQAQDQDNLAVEAYYKAHGTGDISAGMSNYVTTADNSPINESECMQHDAVSEQIISFLQFLIQVHEVDIACVRKYALTHTMTVQK